MEDHEREGLKEFLDGLQLLLDEAVNRHPEWFPSELAGPIESAWRDVRPVFERVSIDIDSRDYDRALEDEGLAGSQLRFKLVGFAAAAREVGIVPRRTEVLAGGLSDSEEANAYEVVPTRKRGATLLKYFRVALDWGNAIVDSIGKAIPAAGAIGEFKKGVEAASRLNEEQSKSRWKRFLGL